MNQNTQSPARSADVPTTATGSAISRPVLLALVAMGLVLAGFLVRRGGQGALRINVQIVAVALAGLAAMLPIWNQTLWSFLQRVRRPSPRARARTTAAIWAISFVYLLCTARSQHRDLFPRIHDECSYTIQAKMLAGGRLWRHAHELADFFETFHFLTKPVYGSIYFPGTALMNVPGVWLHQPSWFMPIVLASLAVSLCYLVVAELIDGLAGLLAALLLLATAMFRVHSTMVMSQVPLMLLGLGIAWAWLRWRDGCKLRWAFLVGALAGWAAITRPVDALAFALPVGLAMAWQLRHNTWRVIGRTLIAVVLGAFPFLALQGAFDIGVTGAAWKTPYVFYLEQNQPGSVFGSTTGQMHAPGSTLPQKQIYFSQLTQGEKAARQGGMYGWTISRTIMTSVATLPCALLLVLIPAGVVAARRDGRWVIAAVIPLFLLLYSFNPFFLFHYAIPLTTAMAFCVVLGARAIEESCGSESGRRFIGTFITTALVALAVASLPQFNRHVHDEPYQTPLLDRTEEVLAELPGPAVVLFNFTPRCNVHEEPVYNLDVTWPDDARVIRAQDLGPRDGELLRYYAARQPDRIYYLFDRASGQVLQLGDAAQAAEALHVRLDLPITATADVR